MGGNGSGRKKHPRAPTDNGEESRETTNPKTTLASSKDKAGPKSSKTKDKGANAEGGRGSTSDAVHDSVKAPKRPLTPIKELPNINMPSMPKSKGRLTKDAKSSAAATSPDIVYGPFPTTLTSNTPKNGDDKSAGTSRALLSDPYQDLSQARRLLSGPTRKRRRVDPSDNRADASPATTPPTRKEQEKNSDTKSRSDIVEELVGPPSAFTGPENDSDSDSFGSGSGERNESPDTGEGRNGDSGYENNVGVNFNERAKAEAKTANVSTQTEPTGTKDKGVSVDQDELHGLATSLPDKLTEDGCDNGLDELFFSFAGGNDAGDSQKEMKSNEQAEADGGDTEDDGNSQRCSIV